jgi:hypothetical protein
MAQAPPKPKPIEGSASAKTHLHREGRKTPSQRPLDFLSLSLSRSRYATQNIMPMPAWLTSV